MTANPSPHYITAQIWDFWQKFDALEPSALLGGVYADKPGYHNTRTSLPATDYSTGRDVDADKLGPGDKASAIDLSMSAQAMVTYTKRLDAAARSGDPRLFIDGKPILREFIGTRDNTTVYCWVFTGGRPLGVTAGAGPDPGRDKSHLWHLHLSFIRQFSTSQQAMDQLLSILRGDPKPNAPKEVDVQSAKELLDADVVPNRPWRNDAKDNPTVRWEYAVISTWDEVHQARITAEQANQKADRILALIQAMTGRDFTDEQAIVAGVLQGLAPSVIASAVIAALPRDVAQQVVDELGRKIAST